MKRWMVIVLLVIAAVASQGSGVEPQPVAPLYKKASPPVAYTLNVHGGRYFVVVETTEPAASWIDSRSTDDGKDKAGEFFEFTLGGISGQKLRIEDGKLTVNGEDRGTVASGDRIKMTGRGKVFVNDTER